MLLGITLLFGLWMVLHGSPANAVNLSNAGQDNADKKLAYISAATNPEITVVDMKNLSVVDNFSFYSIFGINQQSHWAAVTPDGEQIWNGESVTGGIPKNTTGTIGPTNLGYVQVLDAATGVQLNRWDVGNGIGNRMSRDGRWFFSASNHTNSINVFDVVNRTYLGAVYMGENVHVMDTNMDDTVLWATDMTNGNLLKYDISGLPGTLPQLVGSLSIAVQLPAADKWSNTTGGRLHALLVHPNGKYVFVGSNDRSGVNIVDANSMTLVQTKAGGIESAPHNFELSPDQKYLVVSYEGYYT
jgi:hypothetical protein